MKDDVLANWQSPETIRSLLDAGTGEGIRIAIIDSGVEIEHPSFRGRKLADDLFFSTQHIGAAHAKKAVISDGGGIDIFGHGTAVASIAWEVAPQASIGSFRVFGSEKSSKTDLICEAAKQAINLGYKIINCSFGCEQLNKLPKFKSWIDAAYLKGVHIVAAGHNFDIKRQVWPAYFSSVVSTSTLPLADKMSYRYERAHLVEFAANGSDVVVPWQNGEFKTISGTSFAAPRLSGILARILSVKPNLHPLEAKSILIHLSQRESA